MSHGRSSPLKKYTTLFITAIVLSLYGVFVVFAAAPNGGYTPGGTLDPDCAPGDTDCIVAAIGGGSVGIGSTIGNSPDLNGILYTDGTGKLKTDSQFTRDADGVTNILRNFDSVATNQYTFQTGTLYDMNIISGTFTDGETITDTTSGATATLVN